MKYAGMWKVALYTAVLYTSVCAGRTHRAVAAPSDMDDVFQMLMGGNYGGNAGKGKVKKPKGVEAGLLDDDFGDLVTTPNTNKVVKPHVGGKTSPNVRVHSIKETPKPTAPAKAPKQAKAKTVEGLLDGDYDWDDMEDLGLGTVSRPIKPVVTTEEDTVGEKEEFLPETVTESDVKPLAPQTEDTEEDEEEVEEETPEPAKGMTTKTLEDITLEDLIESQLNGKDAPAVPKKGKPVKPAVVPSKTVETDVKTDVEAEEEEEEEEEEDVTPKPAQGKKTKAMEEITLEDLIESQLNGKDAPAVPKKGKPVKPAVVPSKTVETDVKTDVEAEEEEEEEEEEDVTPKPAQGKKTKAMEEITLEDLIESQLNGKDAPAVPKKGKPVKPAAVPSKTVETDVFKTDEEEETPNAADFDDMDAAGEEEDEDDAGDAGHVDTSFDYRTELDDDFLNVGISHKGSEKAHKTKMATKRETYKRLAPTKPHMPADEEGQYAGLAAAIRYLGSGYDIVFGNPLGDPTIMVDPGYRHPVLKLDWTEEFHNHDGTNIKEPRGTWIRPELSCRQAESVDHVNTVEDYKKELSVDAQMSADIPFYFSFSASTGYKNFVKTVAANVTKSYILKTYCLRYVAGVHDLKNVDTMPSFKADVAELPEVFDTDLCPLEKYRNNEEDDDCAGHVRPWMQFFQKYGTHYTTIIHLGGKVTSQIQLKKTDVASLQKNGYNIDAVIKSNAAIPFLNLGQGSFKSSGDTKSESTQNSITHDKLVIVIGGDVSTDGTDKVSMREWTQTLYKKPMPIKVNLESIKKLIKEEKKRSIFDRAIKFYSEAYGISPDEMYKSEGREKGVASLAMGGKSVVFKGRSGGSAVCPPNTVIMMGFALSVTRHTKKLFRSVKYTTSIAPCPVGKEKCVASGPGGDTDVRIWILCGEETIPLLIQETTVADSEPASASCPNDYAIAYGFGMSVPRGLDVGPADGYACRAGQTTCTHSSNKSGRNAVWIACVEKNAPELSDITNHAVAVASPACGDQNTASDYKNNVCPDNTSLIAGWQMVLSESKKDSDSEMATCNAVSHGCEIDKHLEQDKSTCKAHFSWVACYNPPDLFGKKY
ncbi:hypothetical protein BgAZ_500910 [Babesia gibsoni]|uniref:MACPF domain-containing protein n=1 Tax=Babesia gibsoni TaxID=33632 RepID=A0AAD8LJ36_BABGI|nr:hypothetical protein BgAZ_500910 [Babesia gibsoni]